MTSQCDHGDARSRGSGSTTNGDLVIAAAAASTDTPLFDATVRALTGAPSASGEAVATGRASATESTNTASGSAADAALDTGSNAGEPDGTDDNPDAPEQSAWTGSTINPGIRPHVRW
jgi:hypothetical protein